MASHRLQVDSVTGDETLSKLRFVMHGSSQPEGYEVLRTGLRFIEGRATVSANLVQATGYATDQYRRDFSAITIPVAGDPGLITLINIPPQFTVSAAVFTSAYIDRGTNQVLGAPLRYAGARKQLAFFMSPETSEIRLRIQAEVAAGFSLSEHPQFLIDPRFILGSFAPTSGFKGLVNSLDVAARAYEAVDFDRYGKLFTEIYQPSPLAGDTSLTSAAMRQMAVSTVESIIMSRLRMMRWQGLALLGYTFMEGNEQAEIVMPQDVAEQRRRMDDVGRRIASSGLFNGELAWLKLYAAHSLELMRVELDGARLQAQ